MRHPCGDRNALYFDCIYVNILTGILHCSFTRHYYWGKKDKGYTVFSLYYFLQPYVNL